MGPAHPDWFCIEHWYATRLHIKKCNTRKQKRPGALAQVRSVETIHGFGIARQWCHRSDGERQKKKPTCPGGILPPTTAFDVIAPNATRGPDAIIIIIIMPLAALTQRTADITENRASVLQGSAHGVHSGSSTRLSSGYSGTVGLGIEDAPTRGYRLTAASSPKQCCTP